MSAVAPLEVSDKPFPMSEVDWNSDTFLVWARRAACPTEGATAMGRHLRISRQAVYRALALLQKEGLL